MSRRHKHRESYWKWFGQSKSRISLSVSLLAALGTFSCSSLLIELMRDEEETETHVFSSGDQLINYTYRLRGRINEYSIRLRGQSSSEFVGKVHGAEYRLKAIPNLGLYGDRDELVLVAGSYIWRRVEVDFWRKLGSDRNSRWLPHQVRLPPHYARSFSGLPASRITPNFSYQIEEVKLSDNIIVAKRDHPWEVLPEHIFFSGSTFDIKRTVAMNPTMRQIPCEDDLTARVVAVKVPGRLNELDLPFDLRNSLEATLELPDAEVIGRGEVRLYSDETSTLKFRADLGEEREPRLMAYEFWGCRGDVEEGFAATGFKNSRHSPLRWRRFPLGQTVLIGGTGLRVGTGYVSVLPFLKLTLDSAN